MAAKADFPGETEDSSQRAYKDHTSSSGRWQLPEPRHPVLPMAAELPWKALVLREPGGLLSWLTQTTLCVFKVLEFKKKSKSPRWGDEREETSH